MSSTRKAWPKAAYALGGIAIGVALAAGTVATSSALFTSGVSHDDNILSTGSVIMNVNNGDDSAFEPIVAENMVPGDTVYKSILVKNTGTLEFRYAVTSEVTALSTEVDGVSSGIELSKDLAADVKVVTSNADCSAAGWASGTAAANSKTLGGAAPALGPVLNFIGDPTQGGQAGDRVLAASASEILCVQAHLDIDTENVSQNASVKYKLGFDAEQTANND